MTDPAQTLRQFIVPLTGVDRVVIGFSGGADSSALLLAALEARVGVPVVAVHVNHGLSANADAWQSHCESVCRQLQVPLVCVPVEVANQGRGIEDAARRARMQALGERLVAGDLLLTAHHCEDQAETVLLRLARGTGLQGLAAMRPIRPFGLARIGRPFLSIGKHELVNYLEAHRFTWIEDESNNQDGFDRNYLRNQVLPLLTGRWPGFTANAARAAALVGECADLLSDYSHADLAALARRQERLGESILLDPLRDAGFPRLRHLLRLWLAQLGYRAPTLRRTEEISALLNAREDRAPVLFCGDCELRRFAGRLYCLPAHALQNPPADKLLSWAPGHRMVLPGDFTLRAMPCAQGLRGDLQYQVSFRSSPLRAHPFGRTHSQTLKKLLQEHRLEPWLRPFVPLIWHKEHLAAVGDLWVEKDFWTAQPTPAVRLEWRAAVMGTHTSLD